jgi:peptidoglycan/xylan/chitin deacetylase (PgdA/CDA1 family)
MTLIPLLVLALADCSADETRNVIQANSSPGSPASGNSAVVFMYHHFGVSQYPETNISLSQFEAHLTHLQQQAYTVWPLQRIITALDQGTPLPDRTVAITVDDAYISVYTEAWPRLRQLGWPFTVFVSTEVVDQGLPAYMSWDQMREMQQHGATFANHSRHHDYLILRRAGENLETWQQRIHADIDYAQQRLIQELGSAPMLLAYPYGEYNLPLKHLIKSLGYTAVTQQSGAIDRDSDRQRLPRFPMAADFAAIDSFNTKAATLPLPVTVATPEEPVTTHRQPGLTVTLNADKIRDIQLKQLNCYVSGQGQTSVHWLNETRFELAAKNPLPIGRNRYNCTAPSVTGKRYYWFSRLWIVQALDTHP